MHHLIKFSRKVWNLLALKVSFRIFFIIPVLLISLLCFLSAALVWIDFPLNYNQEIAHIQKLKIREDANKDVEIVIIGDSSAGNAIDAKIFSRNTGQKTLNLALTGSYSLAASVLSLQDAIENLPALRYVFFVSTPETWTKPFSDDGYHILRSYTNYDPLENMPEAREARRNYYGWLLTPKRLYWILKRLTGYDSAIRWDPSADYLSQRKQITRSKADLSWERPLQSININFVQNVLNTWDALCLRHDLICISAFGPTYNQVEKTSGATLQNLNRVISSTGKNVRYYKSIITYDYDMLGDNRDHIRPEKKHISTKRYIEIFQSMDGY